MRTFFGIGSILFTAGYAKHLAPSYARSFTDPTVTPAPKVKLELLRKQNANRFMGWLSLSGNSYESVQCDDGLTLYQTADLWRCCATSAASCDIPLGCVSGGLIYSLEPTGTQQFGTVETFDCTLVYTDTKFRLFTICNTGFLYENTQDSDPRTNVFCGTESVNWSYYRVKPDSPTSPPTPDSTPPSPASIAPTPTSTLTTSFSTLPPTGLPIPQRKKSQAWIAGAVAGPIVGFALIGALLFFFLVRKKKDRTIVPPTSTIVPSYSGSLGQQPPFPYTNYPPPMQQNRYSVAPFGVTSPGSPYSYGQQLHQQAGYGHMGSPPVSPELEQGRHKPTHDRPFSAELYHTAYKQPPGFSSELDDTSRQSR